MAVLNDFINLNIKLIFWVGMRKVGILFVFSPLVLLALIPSFTMKSQKELNLPLSSDKGKILLYFGYPGCSETCPGVLTELSTLFESPSMDGIEFQFINILRSSNSKTVDSYAKAYDQEFKGIKLKGKMEEDLFRTFNIEPMEKFSPDFQHKNYLFLLSKKGSSWVLEQAFTDISYAVKFFKRVNQ